MITVYNNIKKLCIERGDLNISQLEKACGIGNGTIGKWRTSNPSRDALEKVAAYLETTPEELLREEHTPALIAVGTYETDLLTKFRQLSEIGKMKILLAVMQEVDAEQAPAEEKEDAASLTSKVG